MLFLFLKALGEVSANETLRFTPPLCILKRIIHTKCAWGINTDYLIEIILIQFILHF